MMEVSPQNTKKSIGKTSFCNIAKSDRANLINTVVYEDFWRPFARKWRKAPRKALGFSVKSDAMSRHRQSWLSPTENCIAENEKMNCGNLINTVDHEDFWRPVAKKWRKAPWKVLDFSVKPDALSRHPRKALFQWENSNLRHQKKLCRKRYKHWCLWRALRSFSRKWQKGSPKPLGK